MTTSNQLALVSWLAQEFGGRQQLGKKAVQKLVHILEEGLETETGYTFSLYTYGAFSRDLAGDIDIGRSVGGLNVDYIASENRYVLTAGASNEAVLARGKAYLESIQPQLERLRAEFSSATARSLELFSTLLFLVRRRKPGDDDAAIVRQLIALKPKYGADETASALQEVNRLLPKPDQTVA